MLQDLTTLYSRVSLFDGSTLVFDALNIGFCVMFVTLAFYNSLLLKFLDKSNWMHKVI